MQVIISAKFDKDLSKIEDEDIRNKIADVIEEVMNLQRPNDINNIKKMKGAKNAFRIRVGNYRIGVLIEKNTIKFARVALRKDIYDIFP